VHGIECSAAYAPKKKEEKKKKHQQSGMEARLTDAEAVALRPRIVGAAGVGGGHAPLACAARLVHEPGLQGEEARQQQQAAPPFPSTKHCSCWLYLLAQEERLHRPFGVPDMVSYNRVESTDSIRKSSQGT
jgi:hypothetical protein